MISLNLVLTGGANKKRQIKNCFWHDVLNTWAMIMHKYTSNPNFDKTQLQEITME